MGLLLLQGSAALNPRELFASGEQGLWLDPSDFSTMWQDSTGVTPCTAAGDPVGLILDQSRGGLANLGPEIVTNGGLSDATGWTASGASPPSITGGQAVWSASTGEIQWASSLTAGKWYKLELDLVSYTSGSLNFRDGTTNTNIATTGTVAGRKTFLINATSTQIRFISFVSTTAVIDNISIREVPGNHAFQTTSASRPTLARIPSSGRRNLLTFSEQLDNAAWTKLQCSISANNSTAPDGTSTADVIVENAATAGRYAQQSLTTTVQTYTFSIYLKNPTLNGRRYALLYHNESVKGWAFDLQNGVVGAGGTVGVTAPAAYGIESVGSGWYRCYITITGTAASNQFRVYPLNNDGSGSASYAGDSVSGILAWGAQLETGSTATSYQKVVATTDVTESGVSDLWHLVFDGSDDSLITNSVDFSATDEMTVIAGVRKLSDAARGTICELTATIASNNGAFHLTAPNAASATYAFESKGTSLTDAVASSVTAPITSVVSGASDISGDTNVIRVNGTQSDSDTGDQGTGNYSNSAIFIGRRNQATLPYTGHIYQLIVRGKTTPTGKLLEAERFVARKTGVTF